MEGLSTVAISYYALNLLSYPLKAVAHRLNLADDLLMALTMPLVVIGVFIFMGAVRRRLTGGAE